MHAMLAERTQAGDQRLSHVVEALVDILQAFRCHGLHAHKCALDVGAPHGLEERGVLGRLHGDLREEHHVGWQFRQAVHQLEPLGAQRPQLLEPCCVALPLRHREIGQCHRIEVVIGQCDEPKAPATELHDLRDNGIHAPLSRLLAVGAPDGAERAMLGAAAHGLDGPPHVATMRQQLPPCRDEALGINASGLVDGLQRAVRHVVQHEGPYNVAIAFDDGMRAAETLRLTGIERRVNATKDDRRPSVPRERTNLVPSKRVAGVNPYSDDVARLDTADIERF